MSNSTKKKRLEEMSREYLADWRIRHNIYGYEMLNDQQVADAMADFYRYAKEEGV